LLTGRSVDGYKPQDVKVDSLSFSSSLNASVRHERSIKIQDKKKVKAMTLTVHLKHSITTTAL